MIVVIATMRSKAGRESEARALLEGLVAPTRKEEGCIQYDLHAAADEGGAFAFYERWSSRTALDAHLASPHLTAALARVPEIMDGAPEIRIYDRIA